MALLHVSHPPAQTCGGEDILYIFFLIFPGHKVLHPITNPCWGPPLAAPCYIPSSLCTCKYGTTGSTSHLAESPPPQLPVSTPPTSLEECFFFNSFVVGLPYSSIFCQFWLFFVFKFVLSSFGCVRRQNVPIYTSILVRSL